MRNFIHDDFMLQSRQAKELYHIYAEEMPIFDYHCHLSPKEIAEDKMYSSITELWLGGDHYKWRALRSNGVGEEFITGSASDEEKFTKWAGTLPYCLGNPLYHWSQLELKRYFGIDTLLGPETSKEVWEKCNEMLKGKAFSARSLITRSKVKALCTTDDPADTLEYHEAIAALPDFKTKVLPSFRPDRAINIEAISFSDYIGELGRSAGIEITDYSRLKEALSARIRHFHKVGCRVSDHGLEPPVFEKTSEDEAAGIFGRMLSGQPVSDMDIRKYKTDLMIFLGSEYNRLGWVMQLHIGTLRSLSSRQLKCLGPNTGFDAMGDGSIAIPVAALLDSLDATGQLPKTILYCINPKDNEVLATIIGAFQDGKTPGKIQFGSGWWFNDQKDGMVRQMTALANVGLLSRFVGMLTDSRSFISYTRHEYFRRILCDMLGEWMERGELPDDMELVGGMVRNICYNNAKDYFGIELVE